MNQGFVDDLESIDYFNILMHLDSGTEIDFSISDLKVMSLPHFESALKNFSSRFKKSKLNKSPK